MSKKSNFNIGSIIIIIILLQLGVRGFKEINKKSKAKSNSEARELCLKKNKGNDISSCNELPPHFFKLVEEMKKQNVDKSKIENKN